jgi:hypothetical protein
MPKSRGLSVLGNQRDWPKREQRDRSLSSLNAALLQRNTGLADHANEWQGSPDALVQTRQFCKPEHGAKWTVVDKGFPWIRLSPKSRMWAVHARAFLKQRPPRRPPRSKRMSIPWRRSCQHSGSAEAYCGEFRAKKILLVVAGGASRPPRKRLIQRTGTNHDISISGGVKQAVASGGAGPDNLGKRRRGRSHVAETHGPVLRCKNRDHAVESVFGQLVPRRGKARLLPEKRGQ